MTYLVSNITVAQAATIINAFITFIHFTISLSLVILLVKFMPKANTALSWSNISRTLHSSIWPTILRADSDSNRTSGTVVSTTSLLATLTTVLVAVAGVLLPLGLSQGPIVPANFRQLDAQYVPDTSPLALSTTPDRGRFVYGRQCGGFHLVPCPGNDNPNVTTIAPSTMDIFNSTPHGPFTMQYRRFMDGDPTQNQNCSAGFMGSAETFMLRNDTFAAEGLIIDMTPEHPGIGFWNQTLPEVPRGGTWSQDIMWLEPVTQCVDTNLTIDYFLTEGPDGSIKDFNITDRGGFVNLTHEPPSLNRDGQHIDLYQHAYKGAAYSDLYALLFLNATREGSYIGASYPINSSSSAYLFGSGLNKINVLPLSYLNGTATSSTKVVCQGYGSADTANITNVHVSCGIFLGPPLRTDGGDPQYFNRGSKWSQGVYGCTSATRASIQTVTFSNNASNIQDIQITRQLSGLDVLWATEKTDLTIGDVDLFWGRVDDRYENDPSLWTTRADSFYLPAGGASIWNVFPVGLPAGAHAHVWGQIYDPISLSGQSLTDYSGQSDYALKARLQSLVAQDPITGNANIRNLIWTDIMANNVIGTQTNRTLWVADHLNTLQYDFKYAIPGFLLFLIWLPSFFGALFLLLTRSLTFAHMRNVLNHTSVGRVVVGTSALRTQGLSSHHQFLEMPQPDFSRDPNFLPNASSLGHRRNRSDWANTMGTVIVGLELGQNQRSVPNEEDIKLMEHSPR
ncbi:hypothetical protein P691DRAFT_727314 [Macrolepiota fuliginosa MF-IS2]|uniref:Uncharacterized protein n=1 Tax=Macrolepiota fuliginosa MF-IS2 TaxID=1400762 RepID=A0A9P5XGB6_9AGAR|nr:hypothetical protein P691DRAFT_727314 [Macrolepiota fuliginosa MF-IS2]